MLGEKAMLARVFGVPLHPTSDHWGWGKGSAQVSEDLPHQPLQTMSHLVHNNVPDMIVILIKVFTYSICSAVNWPRSITKVIIQWGWLLRANDSCASAGDLYTWSRHEHFHPTSRVFRWQLSMCSRCPHLWHSKNNVVTTTPQLDRLQGHTDWLDLKRDLKWLGHRARDLTVP